MKTHASLSLNNWYQLMGPCQVFEIKLSKKKKDDASEIN